MMAFGGAGRGGADMEEAYMFFKAIAYPVPSPQLDLSASRPQ